MQRIEISYIYFTRYISGAATSQTQAYTFAAGTTYRCRVEWLSTGVVTVTINGVLAATFTADTTYSSGYCGYYFNQTTAGNLSMEAYDFTYVPSIAFSDSFAIDDETRYMQLQFVAAWGAADAGDVVVTTGAGGYMTLAGTGGDEARISATLRSYNFASESYKAAFITPVLS